MLLPGLAAAEAGPASILAWLGLLCLSGLFAVVFAGLGRAAATLMFSFVGREAVAPLTGRFRDPGRQLPRTAPHLRKRQGARSGQGAWTGR